MYNGREEVSGNVDGMSGINFALGFSGICLTNSKRLKQTTMSSISNNSFGRIGPNILSIPDVNTPKCLQGPRDHFMVSVKKQLTSANTDVKTFCVGPPPCFRVSYVKSLFREDEIKSGALATTKQLLSQRNNGPVWGKTRRPNQ